MKKNEIRLKIAEAIEKVCKGYDILQEISEQLSVEEITDENQKKHPFNHKNILIIKDKTINILKKRDLTFQSLYLAVKEKVSPKKIALTYPKLKFVLSNFPEFKKKNGNRTKRMGRTPLVYSYIGVVKD